MKKILILLALLLGLLAIAYFAIPKEESDSSITKNDRDFRIENVHDIHKIKMKSRRMPEMHLSRSGNEWLINYKHTARQNTVKRLLEITKEMRLKYIPHRNALPGIKDEMELLGVHVELLDKNDQLLKSYVVGSGTADERGTYVQMTGSNQPYVMEMAAYEGSIRGLFYLTPEEWRDRSILRENTDQIKKVTVEYPKSKNDSFVLDVEQNTVEPFYSHSLQSKARPKEGTLLAYLKGFEQVNMEAFENNHPKKDSISQLVPFMRLTIENTDNTSKELKFFPIRDLKFYDINTSKIEDTKNVERYFVSCSWGDFIMAQQLLVKKLFRPIDYFYE